jgi:hypothetical protein
MAWSSNEHKSYGGKMQSACYNSGGFSSELESVTLGDPNAQFDRKYEIEGSSSTPIIPATSVIAGQSSDLNRPQPQHLHLMTHNLNPMHAIPRHHILMHPKIPRPPFLPLLATRRKHRHRGRHAAPTQQRSHLTHSSRSSATFHYTPSLPTSPTDRVDLGL